MTSTDLKNGDFAEHPKKGPGIVVALGEDMDGSPLTAICHLDNRGWYRDTYDLTGWERVETVRPGHVQVRVDDLADELSRYAALGQGTACLESNVMLRVTRALDAQRAESAPPADEKPMSAAVTLFCPDCGEAENVTVVMLGKQSNGERWFDLREFHAHTCPPVQPDEPTEFGARVTLTPDLPVADEQWCRQHDGYWANADGELMTWAYLCQRGAVTLGWDE